MAAFSNRFCILFPFVMLLASVANCGEPPAVTVTVSIESLMGAGTTLSVHCRTDWRGPRVPIIDLGEHKLRNSEVYSFNFPQAYPEQLDKKIYHCLFKASGFPNATVGVYFGSYFPHWACECVDGNCPLWTVKREGFFCGGVKMHSWLEG